ncbi:MAG: hypothetical protein LBH90_02865 [Tannerella sp.]|jgi:hypothetical protein|nr:hypothetical protein [Tannerella sp.]
MNQLFRYLLTLLFCSGTSAGLYAQKNLFDYHFYGFVRGDWYFNSRQNTDAVDGLFYLLPGKEKPDANGNDLNAKPNGSFYTFTTRLGMDIKGPDIGAARSSAKIETDFGGSAAGGFFLLRIRQAYVRLDWNGGSTILLGHTWHPFFGDVIPQVLNLSTGAPFQPFYRTPQIRYQYTTGKWVMQASALYQLMYLSAGPSGKTEDYMKNGVWPEVSVGLDYLNNGLLVGAGAAMLSLKPRMQSEMGDKVYRVDERITTFSLEAHAKYTSRLFYMGGKALLASNMNHAAMAGGYGVSSIHEITGAQTYTPFRHATAWVNAVYGNKWQGGVFGGYTKNLGTAKALTGTDKIYGLGMDLDQLLTASAHFSYNLPHWKMGVEYQAATGSFGDIDLSNGKIKNTNDVTNHRILAVFMYYF